MTPVCYRHLNRQQVGTYAEYFAKMHMALHGFQIFTSEVDDRGIDFVARHGKSQFLEVQVKSLRSAGYVFMEKTKFQPHDGLHLALVILLEGQEPDIYYIPSNRWKTPDRLFRSRDYEGLKSKPEWGLNLSKRNLPKLAEYRIGGLLEALAPKG